MPAMRHLGSLLTGLIAAPAVWLLLAVGQPRTMATINRWTTQDEFHPTGLIGPVAYLAAAGLIAGLIACLRVSPAGPTVAGLAFAGLYGALFVVPLRVIDLIPKRLDLALVDAQPRVPVVNGTLGMLAVLFLVALWSPGRWRRWPSRRREPATPADSLQASDEPPSELILTLAPEAAPSDKESSPPSWPQPAERATTPIPTDAPAEPEPPTPQNGQGEAGSLPPVLSTSQSRPATLAD